MRLAKFIKKLDNGEITDLKPYIEKEKLDILLEIADRGLEVDYLLRRGETEVIRTLIQNGHASESDMLLNIMISGNIIVTKPFVKKWPRRVSSVMSLSKT